MLLIFQHLSGLKINFHKSELLALNYNAHDQRRWADTLGCNIGSWPLKYLGVSLGLIHNSRQLWDPMILKFNNKLNNWANLHLNLAGKLVLLKATLDSLPIYWFNFFHMPVGIRKKLDMIRRTFLWGKDKLHPIKWDIVTLNKSQGRLGVSNLEHRNSAMFGKN